ncbi:MAG: acetyl-CoA acetyltransferase [Acidimicrobiia bacterium]
MVDARTPVIVGIGQVAQRFADPTAAAEPIRLLEDAARAADTDANARRSLLDALDTVAVVEMLSWRYPDPGAFLARNLGIEPRSTVTSTVGGNSPQLLVNEMAADIARGDRRAVLVGGAECMYARRRARREPKVRLEWSRPADPPCPTVVGDPRPGTTDEELAHLAVMPTDIYPLFETALRAAAGRSVDDQQHHIARLWAPFSEVAAGNAHAWSQRAFAAAEIDTPAPDNRVVAFPYLKRMCANLEVDQAAAIILCSHEAARDAGVPDDRLVFPLAGADAHDHFHVSERWALGRSVAIGVAVGAMLRVAGLGVDDVARFDLYSCFPSAVQLALESIGLRGPQAGDERPLTTTGGLAFAGGPGNNYVTHAIAATVDACRRDPGSVGLVTALGWYATKHSVGCYSTTPPGEGFRRVPRDATQAIVDATPSRVTTGCYSGPATVEATSVVFDRDGEPNVAIVTALEPGGRRVWANTRDESVLSSMTTTPWEGRPVRIADDGSTNIVAS